MADAITDAPAPEARKRRVWLRVLTWLLAFLVFVLIALYFVATSSSFFEHTVLPRVSQSLNANVTVSFADIHPFSQITLRDLKIQSDGQPVLATVPEVRVKYSLLDILGGNIRVDEIALVSPTVQIVENADGASNLDPILKSRQQTAGQKAQPGKPAKPLKIDLRKLTLSDATIFKIQNHKAGTRDLVELTNLDLTLTGVKNGDTGKIQFSAVIRDENNPPAPAMYGLLHAKIAGAFNFALTPDLMPGSVVGDAHLNIAQAAGSYSDFSKLDGSLHCDVSSSEIKNVTFNFEKEGVPLGELHASGPYDTRKREGNLSVELLEVDRRVLNLFAAKSGFDFGSTSITSTNRIELTKSGTAISAVGQLDASKLQLSRANETTPPVELRADYNVSFDNTEKTALLRTLNVAATQNARPLLRCELTSPMTLAWGKATNAVGDSSFSFTVTKLNLTDWKTFAGNLASAGTLDLNLKLLSQEGGKRLTFDATNQIQNLTTQFGAQRISDATVILRARGQATNLKQINLNEYNVQVMKSNLIALTMSGSGAYDRSNNNADLQVVLKTTVPRALQLLGASNIASSSGSADLKAHVTQKQQIQTVTGNLTVTNFSGKIGKNEFKNFGVTTDFDVNKTQDRIEIRRAVGNVVEGKSPGGDFDISGTYGLANKPSQITAKLSDFNQNSLRPFLEPLLTDKKLVSVTLDGTASAQRNPNGDSSVKADLQIANFVVSDPEHRFPSTPLEAKVQLDAGVAKQIADIRQLQVTLTPTPRAKNQFQLQGRVDTSNTNFYKGNLKLTADSLDLTWYYDLFAGTNKASAKTAIANKTQTVAASTNQLPSQALGTNQLPFRNFKFESSVHEFYLREIAATNFVATVKLDSNRVVLKPCQLTLNGSPVNAFADVDFSVPGLKYTLTLNAPSVPFAPLWNTFKPDEKGKVGGTLTAQVDISGVGTSGESLQKTLAGKFDIGTTNLNLAVDKIRNPLLLLPVMTVMKLPEIMENPLGAAASILGGLKNVFTGGLSEDVAQSPIDIISVRARAENGRVILQQVVVRSSVFQADVTNGTITLATVLTNSPIDIPIGFSLRKSIAPRVQALVAGDATTNASYTRLTDFFSEVGTIGDPKPKIKALALGKGLVESLVPDFTGTNGITGSLLHDVRDLLKPGESTNQPATNRTPANNPTNHAPPPGGK